MKLRHFAWVILALPLFAVGQTINIAKETPYYDEKIIQPNIVNECTDLGAKLSTFTKSYSEKNGFTVALSDKFNSANPGYNLKLEITNAVSAGNAWMGHAKGVTISMELYKDGKQVASHTLNRNSSGGIGAGFKSSCDVLGRCTKALGKDVGKILSKWRKQGLLK